MILAYLIVAGLSLYVLFRLIERFLMAVLRRESQLRYYRLFFPLAEGLVWIGYAFWAVSSLFRGFRQHDLVMGAMALVLILALAWFVLRDFIAGILIKSDTGLHAGQQIRTSFASGRVHRLGARALVLINQEGELVRIPWARFRDETIILPPRQDQRQPHRISLRLPPEASFEAIRRQASEQLMAMPWVTGPAPELHIRKDADEHHYLHITFYTHDPAHVVKVEEKLIKLIT